jgi:hypothetical protein
MDDYFDDELTSTLFLTPDDLDHDTTNETEQHPNKVQTK